MPPSDEGHIEKLRVLDKGTLVPISIAISIIVVFLAAWGWFNNQFNLITTKIDSQIKTSDERFVQYDRRMERVEARTSPGLLWTAIDATLWVSEFRRLNPEMKIPLARRE
jgi:hypothetical protein